MSTIVISGFPGVGKSRMANTSSVYHFQNGWKSKDLESSIFDKLDPKWTEKYIDVLQEILRFKPEKYRYIFVSSHKEVRDEMKKRGIPYIVIVPELDSKEEYLARYLKRGDSMEFIDNAMDHWDEWLTEIDENEKCVLHLNKVDYLSDVI